MVFANAELLLFIFVYTSWFSLTLNLVCFCQIASLLSDTSSILTDCMQTFSQAQDLKIMLGTQQDLSQLKDIGEV